MDRLVKNSGWYLNLVGIALAAPIVRFRGPKKVATFDEDTGAKDDGQKLGEDALALPLRAWGSSVLWKKQNLVPMQNLRKCQVKL